MEYCWNHLDGPVSMVGPKILLSEFWIHQGTKSFGLLFVNADKNQYQAIWDDYFSGGENEKRKSGFIYITLNWNWISVDTPLWVVLPLGDPYSDWGHNWADWADQSVLGSRVVATSDSMEWGNDYFQICWPLRRYCCRRCCLKVSARPVCTRPPPPGQTQR